ncbi:MAG TPA: hypothetical protein VII43_08205 [Opitutaceae bacterium]
MSQSPLHGWMHRLALPAMAFAACAGLASGQTTLVAASPFAPAGAASAAAGAPAQAYELAGSSVQGSDVLVCIFDRQAKHSEWIPVGGVSGAIHVISYDQEHDKVLVTISGATKEIGLREAAPVASAPVASPAQPETFAAAAPAGPVSPATPASLAHDQNEARMLVSDLLEIGVQQRKAYQEAKRKAATEQPAQPTN